MKKNYLMQNIFLSDYDYALLKKFSKEHFHMPMSKSLLFLINDEINRINSFEMEQIIRAKTLLSL